MTTVAVVGCTHAGTFAAMSILNQHPDWTVHVFERNDTLSFLSCGIALWVGNHVSDPSRMFYSSPDALASQGATMHMKTDVLDVDVAAQTLRAKDLQTGNVTEYAFDKLVITTGSKAVVPPIDGLSDALANQSVLLCKNWQDANTIKERVKHVKSAIVIGAGYIGSELAEQMSDIGIETTLIDALPRVLANNYDPAITDMVEANFKAHDVTTVLGEQVVAFRTTTIADGEAGAKVSVITDRGEYAADVAVLGIGFAPNTGLFVDQLQTYMNGAIIVDKYMHASSADGTRLENVFAAGDSATVHYNPTGKDDYIPLATNAVRQGSLIGANIDGDTAAYLGTQSTSAVQLYDTAYAATGLTLESAQRKGVPARSTSLTQDYRPDFMLTTTPVTAILVWNPEDRRILGAQFASQHDITEAANVVSVAIQAGFTIDQLAGADLFFQPNFTQPINFVGAVALQAVAEQGK